MLVAKACSVQPQHPGLLPPPKKNTAAFTIFPATVARVVKAPLAKKFHHTRRYMRVVYTGDSQRNVYFTFLNVVDGGVVDLGVFHSQQQAALKRDRGVGYKVFKVWTSGSRQGGAEGHIVRLQFERMMPGASFQHLCAQTGYTVGS